MDKYAPLSQLFGLGATTGTSDLDKLFGLRPTTDEELAAKKAERQARIDALLSEEQGVEPSGTTKIPELSGSAKERAQQIAPAIRAASEKHKVPFDLLMGMTQVESGFNPAATSKVGAEGTAQFMPPTARQYGLTNTRDPVASADAQARYMRDLLDMFGGDETKAIAAYNAGQGTIQRAKGIPNMGYVNSVQAARSLYSQSPAIQSPAGSPADQLLPSAQPEQPQVDPNKFDLVTLTDGSQAYFEKGMKPDEMLGKLQADGVKAVPTRPFTTPSGEPVLVQYDMSDDEALKSIGAQTPELLQRPRGLPAQEDKSGALDALKQGAIGGVGTVALGLGDIGQYAARKLGPESTVGKYAGEFGQAVHQYGEEAEKRAAEAFNMPEDASWLAKNLGYPFMKAAGESIPYAAAAVVPGTGLVKATSMGAALLGGAYGQAEQKAKEVGKPFEFEEATPTALADATLNYFGQYVFGPLKGMFGPEAVQAPQAFVRSLIEKEGIDGAKAKMGSMVTDVLKNAGITGGAEVANEVAEDMLYRGYGDQDLFSPEALQSYIETAKQVAPFGVGMGGIHGVAQRSAKVEALTREEEQKAAAEAEAGQISREQEMRLAEDMKGARVNYERLGIETPDALAFPERRQAFDDYVAGREAEKEALRAELPEDLQQLPLNEAQLLQKARGEQETYYAPLGLPERGKNIAVKRRALEQLDINNPTHAPTIGKVLDEIEASNIPHSAEGMQFLRQRLSEVPSASEIESTIQGDGRGVERPQGSQEIGYPPVGGEGIRPSDQEGQGLAGEIREVKGAEKVTVGKSLVGDRGEKLQIPEGYIDVQHTFEGYKPPAASSVVDFHVEEGARGQGKGKELIDAALRKYPDLGAQVSSLPSLKAFHDKGFRNPSLLEGSFADYKKLFAEQGGSLFMRSPKTPEITTPDIREVKGAPKEVDKAYHAGDLGYGLDTGLGRISGGRGTGHFGTGVYFVGDKTKIGSREGRPMHEIDFSDYNLARPDTETDAQGLHEGLRIINRLVDQVKASKLQLRNEKFPEFRSDEGYAVDEAASKIKYALMPKKDGKFVQPEDIAALIKKHVEERAPIRDTVANRSVYEDTAATRVMKDLGYEGIDVRHLPKFDNADYGSVIYKESLAPETRKFDTAKPEIREVAGAPKTPSVENKIMERMAEVPEEGDPGINCDVFAHRITGTSFKKLPTVERGQEKVGDVYAFGKSHYAVNVGEGRVAEVEEWGSPPQVRDLKEVIKEHDEPTHIYSVPEEAYTGASEIRKVAGEPMMEELANPDIGKQPLDVTKFSHATNARDLIDAYLQHGTDADLKNKMEMFKSSPYAGAVRVKFVGINDPMPEIIRSKFKEGAGAMSAPIRGKTPKDDFMQLFFRKDSPIDFSESNVAHEVTHAMTQAAISRNPALRGELVRLAGSIHSALKTDHPKVAEFWDFAVKDQQRDHAIADETIAYGVTSPTLRDILSKYDENGNKIEERPAQAKAPEAPPVRTMWDKFKDFVAKLFGIPSGKREAFSKSIDANIDANPTPVVKPITAKLNEALEQAFRETVEAGGVTPRKATTAPKTSEARRVGEEKADFVQPTPEEQAKLVEEAKKSGLTAVAQGGDLGASVGAMMSEMANKGVLLPFQTAVFDERAPIANALNKLGANVGKKLRADSIWGAYSQRFNTIQQAINSGYTMLGKDGTLESIENSQLAPQKIFERVRSYGKKLGMSEGEAWKVVSEMLVRLRAGTIREQDAKIRQDARDYMAAADELDAHAATRTTSDEKRKFKEAANKLRRQAQEKLDSIGDDGRTYISQEEVETGRKLYMAYKDTLSKEVDNIHELLRKVPDKMLATGMVDAKQAEALKNYPFYFPFYDRAKFDEEVLDPLKEETLQRYLGGMGRGLKSVAEIKRQESHGHTIYTADNLLRHLMYWDSAVAEHAARTATCEQLEMTGGATRLMGEPSDKNFVVKVKRDGRDTYYKIHDPNVYYAFQASAPVTGPIIDALRKMARFQRGVAVFNPLFWYKQIIRDPKQVSRVGKVGIITPLDALGELAKITAGKSKGYERIVAKGVVGPVDIGSNPQERIRSLIKGKGFSTKVYNKLNEIHEAVDAATRAIVYDRALTKYKKWGIAEDVADALAIKDAREVMNFSRKGKSRALNALRSVTPFLGSYINSIDVLLKAISPATYGKMSKADAMEMRRAFLGISSSIATLSLGYSLLMSDDEEWVNSADRNGNIMVRNPFSNKKEKPFIMLPLEFEVGWLQHTLPENMLLANLGAIAPTTEKANLKESAAKALMPPMDFFSYARPLILSALQYEDTRAPGADKKGYEGLKKFQDDKATEFSKMLAKELEKSGIQMLSPNDIENYMNDFFGGYWSVAQSASAYMLAHKETGAVAPAKTMTEMLPWFGKAFSGEYRDVAVRDAFKVLNDIQEVQNTFSGIKASKDLSKYNEFIASPEYVKAVQADKALNGLSEKMSSISTKMSTIIADESIKDPQEKRRIIDGLNQDREDIAKEILKRAKAAGVFE